MENYFIDTKTGKIYNFENPNDAIEKILVAVDTEIHVCEAYQRISIHTNIQWASQIYNSMLQYI